MIISNSQVGMVSTHKSNVTKVRQTAQFDVPESQAKNIHISMEQGDYVTQLNKEKNRILEEQSNASNTSVTTGQSAQTTLQTFGSNIVKTHLELQQEIMKHLFEALERKLSRHHLPDTGTSRQTENGLRSYAKRVLDGTAIFAANGTSTPLQMVAGGVGTVWTKTVATSSFYQEEETTAYSAKGIVQTADGRQISFGVQVEMSRSFCEQYEEIIQENYIYTDPLVINYGGDTANITDQKFLFDLDSDGTAEEMHFTAEGSGFLALDKNGDGVINDGKELFGTKSGDGFRDLAAYDSDGNSWIDEADSVFADLKIYTRDAQGKDVLLSLKEAGVGAIYLGNVSTEFSMKDSETNEMQAQVRKTGVFLFENGGAGTVQHIDFAV